jgi:Ca2+-binding EF-hand superfamily protein
MKTLGHKVSEAQLKEIMKLIDQNGNGNLIFFFFLLCFKFYIKFT